MNERWWTLLGSLSGLERMMINLSQKAVENVTGISRPFRHGGLFMHSVSPGEFEVFICLAPPHF